MPKSVNVLWAVLAAVVFSRLFAMIGLPMADTTEPRYAEIARVMAVSGDWITPWFKDGVPFWGKPPLSFWAEAASFRVLGFNDFAARLPSWLCTLAILALIFHQGRATGGKRHALVAGLIFTTMALAYVSAGAVMTDPFLTLGTTLSLVAFLRVLDHDRPAWRWLFFLGLAIGLLAKGPLALVLVGLPLLGWTAWQRQWHWLLHALPWARGSLLVGLLVLPWYVAAELKTPGFLSYFIIGEHLMRFLDPGWNGDLYGSAHRYPHGMIWVFWTWATFPWGLLALGALLIALFRPRKRQALGRALADQALRFELLAALAPGVFFTFAGNTLWTYLLPALPFTALLMARVIHSGPMAPKPRKLWGLTAVALIVPVLANIASGYVAWHPEQLNTEKRLVQVYRDNSTGTGIPLLYLDEVPFSARYYSRGHAQAATVEGIRQRLQAPGESAVYLAVRKRQAGEIRHMLSVPSEVLFLSHRYALLYFSPSLRALRNKDAYSHAAN
ncbi:glycosyltransferase family 39 protein [Marinobacteraceae bacterium S3BR75-40.1]